MKRKPFWKSKTVWTGATMVALSGLGYAQEIFASRPGLVAAIGAGMGLLVIVLRFLSDGAVQPTFRVIGRQ